MRDAWGAMGWPPGPRWVQQGGAIVHGADGVTRCSQLASGSPFVRAVRKTATGIYEFDLRTVFPITPDQGQDLILFIQHVDTGSPQQFVYSYDVLNTTDPANQLTTIRIASFQVGGEGEDDSDFVFGVWSLINATTVAPTPP